MSQTISIIQSDKSFKIERLINLDINPYVYRKNKNNR